MGICYSADHIAEDLIHIDITSNIEEILLFYSNSNSLLHTG